MKMSRSSAAVLAVCCLGLFGAAGAALAGPDVLTQGADLWHTATGASFSSFADNPIPAGFFCGGSPAFTGVIAMEGKPLVTSPAGALGGIDTIIRRLDDAVLDAKGEGSTRIQLLALSLAGTRPVDVGCGRYDVTASLDGEQPITEMKLWRTVPEGGFYMAPLKLAVKLVFTPAAGTKGEQKSLTHHISLGPGTNSVWSYNQPAAAKSGLVQVDTNGDSQPDTVMPAPSNFTVGLAASDDSCYREEISCHCATFSHNPYEPNAHCIHLHCVKVKIPCHWPKIEPYRKEKPSDEYEAEPGETVKP